MGRGLVGRVGVRNCAYLLALPALFALLPACGPRAGTSSPAIQFTEIGSGIRVVDVVGLGPDVLAGLSNMSDEERAAALRVHVDGAADSSVPAMSGSHAVVGDRFRFTPAFPLDENVAYRAVFEHQGKAPLVRVVPASARPSAPTTRATGVYPPDTLLENQLRVYIQFSAPMSNRGADTAIRLLDDRGAEVDSPFLPIDVHLWNEDRTRYTLLFDPGRVKRGIMPNMEKGRALERGRRYTLVVDREWRDAEGRPLAESFRREFRVVPEVLDPLAPADWRLAVPRAATRDPLTVTFPRMLDHALAQRMLFVTTAPGGVVDGSAAVDDQATAWTFTPKASWKAGAYRLRALSELEDPAGNRIGRAFDYDAARVGESVSDKHAEAALSFRVR